MKNDTTSVSSSKTDARAVFLHSREIQTVSTGGKSMEMFSYYDSISVDKVKVSKDQPLSSAYDHAVKQHKNQIPEKDENGPTSALFQQSLLLFTDIKEKKGGQDVGYTREKIKKFWHNSDKEPILFMTMFHLGREVGLKDGFEKISEVFKGRKHLIYFGFDYSDLILFYRGSSFKEYTDLVYQIDYQIETPFVVDSITLYSFDWQYCDKASETFIANFRIGVTDYNYAQEALKKIRKNFRWTKFMWTLGRNDIGLYNGKATLRWIKDVYGILQEVSGEKNHPKYWCTTRDLCIFTLPPKDNQIQGHTESVVDISEMREILAEKAKAFGKAYEECCQRLDVKADLVWLNWLSNASLLAATFFDNKMSAYMGTCLVPQFLDMFEYETRLLKSNLDIGSFKEVRLGMSSFFTSILTLIDSMNQSNRQAVQAPAFRTETFDMPPKIMAYYTAVSQLLINALRDDLDKEDRILYSFAISPQFTQVLKVQSLAMQKVLPKDQFMLIGIGERSLYTLQLTTEILTHEIAHLVGEGRRCREERSACMFKCALHSIVAQLYQRMCTQIDQEYGRRWRWPVFTAGDKEEAVLALYQELINSNSEYTPSADHYAFVVKKLIDGLPHELMGNPSVNRTLFKVILNFMLPQYTDKGADHGDDDAEELRNKLANSQIDFTGLNDYEKEYFEGLHRKEKMRIIDTKLRDIFDAELRQMSDGPVYAYDGTEESPKYLEIALSEQLRYLFQETFADLQTVLLLKLDWKAYYDYLDISKDTNSDMTVRILALIQALGEDPWNMDSIEGYLNNSANKNRVVPSVKALVRYEPLFDGEKYDEEDVNALYVYYLSEYLKKCKESTDQGFSAASSNYRFVKEVRDIHKALGKGASVLSMQNAILSLIRQYKADIEKRYGLKLLTENQTK